MKIVSIDVHVRKKCNLFDGDLHAFTVEELRHYLSQLHAGKPGVIIAINAPTTGYVEAFEGITSFSTATTRAIEAFFTNKGFGYSTTRRRGVKVTNYASLPYWAVVQNLFSLNLSRNRASGKYRPIFRRKHVKSNKLNLLELHPDLALFLLQKEGCGWSVQGKKDNFDRFKNNFCACMPYKVGCSPYCA